MWMEGMLYEEVKGVFLNGWWMHGDEEEDSVEVLVLEFIPRFRQQLAAMFGSLDEEGSFRLCMLFDGIV